MQRVLVTSSVSEGKVLYLYDPAVLRHCFFSAFEGRLIVEEIPYVLKKERVLAEFGKVLYKVIEAVGYRSYRAEDHYAVAYTHSAVCVSYAHGAPDRVEGSTENGYHLKSEFLNVSVYSLFQTVLFYKRLLIREGASQVSEHVFMHTAYAHFFCVFTEIKGTSYVFCASVYRLLRGFMVVLGYVFKPSEDSENERKQTEKYQPRIDNEKQYRVGAECYYTGYEVVKRIHYL